MMHRKAVSSFICKKCELGVFPGDDIVYQSNNGWIHFECIDSWDGTGGVREPVPTGPNPRPLYESVVQ